MSLSPAKAAADPHFLPHRLWLDDDRVELIPTDRASLSSASFLDGREDFSTGPPVTISLHDLLSKTGHVPGPDRYIFHVAFCGSTLLSRLLDVEGRALLLREPQALVDVAVRWAAVDSGGAPDPNLPLILGGVRALLRRRWQAGEPVVIKPTNWINNILLDLCSDRDAIRPLFLTTTRSAFIQAVFRGGSDRLAFAARAAVHLSSRGTGNAELIAAALARETDQTGKLAGLAVATHEIQMRLFRDAIAAGGWGTEQWLTMEDLVHDPLTTARRASRTLGLEIAPAALEENCARWTGRHAKQPDTPFSAVTEKAGNEAISAGYGDHIADALAWADHVIGPDQGIFVRSHPVTESRGSVA
jgi:hypothetical protein